MFLNVLKNINIITMPKKWSFKFFSPDIWLSSPPQILRDILSATDQRKQQEPIQTRDRTRVVSSTQAHPRAASPGKRQHISFGYSSPMNGGLLKGKALKTWSLTWRCPHSGVYCYKRSYLCEGPVNLLSNMNGVKHKNHVTFSSVLSSEQIKQLHLESWGRKRERHLQTMKLINQICFPSTWGTLSPN